jgi:hypothetical protein
VEETGAHIDDDTNSPLPSTNNEPTMWTITDVTEQIQQRDQQIRPPATAINENKGLDEKEKIDIPQTAKKKKSPKTRKSSIYIFLNSSSVLKNGKILRGHIFLFR